MPISASKKAGYLKQALKDKALVEKFLRAGNHPTGLSGCKRPSAISLSADSLGTARSTFRDRVGTPNRKGSNERVSGVKVDWSLYTGPDELTPAVNVLGGTDADTRRVALEDKVRRLEASLKEAHRNKITDDALREIFGTLGKSPQSPPDWLVEIKSKKGKPTPEVPVVILSDWHIGEVVKSSEVNGLNSYSMAVAEKRVHALVDNILNLCRNHHSGNYPGIVVNLLGDFVSGELHMDHVKTDEQPCIPQCLKARDLLVWALKTLADEFGYVYCPCSAGNHGRLTMKPESKEYVLKNWDWMIYQLLIRAFENDPRIKIDCPDSNEVFYPVWNKMFLAIHGDMMGVKGGDGIIGSLGPIARGEVKTSRQNSSYGRDYDFVLMGHWHQQFWLPRAVVANCLIGFNEFAHKFLRAVPTPPSQPMFFVHPRRGITARWEVLVEEPAKGREMPWVSWAKGA